MRRFEREPQIFTWINENICSIPLTRHLGRYWEPWWWGHWFLYRWEGIQTCRLSPQIAQLNIDCYIYTLHSPFEIHDTLSTSRIFLAIYFAMCGGETGRSSFGGTIAVLFPQENELNSSLSSEVSLSSSPSSVISSASTSSSTSYISSYSLFFRDTDRERCTTKAIFQTNDTNTYNALRGCKYLDMRIE